MCRLALSSHPLGSQLYRLMWHCWKGGAHYSVNTSNAVNLHSGAKQSKRVAFSPIVQHWSSLEISAIWCMDLRRKETCRMDD